MLLLGGWGCARPSREPSARQRIDQLAGLPADMSLDSLRQTAPWLVCRLAKAGAPYDHTCAWEGGGFSALAGTRDHRLAQIGVVWIGNGQPDLDLDAWAQARYGTPSGSTACTVNAVRYTVTWWTKDDETIVVRHGRGPWGALHLGSHRLHWVPSCERNEGLDVLTSLRPEDW